MKKFWISALSLLLCALLALPAFAVGEVATGETQKTYDCTSAILMDAATGEVLFEQNADAALPPASVTKVMTLLLVMEAIEQGKIALDDMVRVSANAAGMGGSQVFLKEGEEMSVEEMLKCVVIASANDCAVALAEFVSGSEENFVRAMNERAAELSMKNTNFENTNGLDDTVTNHVTSARDIAIMSRELIKYEKILEFSGTWMDSIRDGAFGLTNTNRLVRYYPGCTGLKTGSTAKAGFCISATAEREGLSLICVVMGAKTRDERNTIAASLFDLGFASYAAYRAEAGERVLRLRGSEEREMIVRYDSFVCAVPKGRAKDVTIRVELPDVLDAPLDAGEEIGAVIYTLDGAEIGRVPILCATCTEKISFGRLFAVLFSRFLMI